MELKDLQAQLTDPDPWIRVEALRILAMVEETRALPDIQRVFKNDPEPGVQQVAQWAGRIVYQASQRNPAAGVPAELPPVEDTLSDLHESALIHSLLDKDRNVAEYSQLQLLQYDLTRRARAAKTTTGILTPISSDNRDVKSLGLLESGLSADLLQYFLKKDEAPNNVAKAD